MALLQQKTSAQSTLPLPEISTVDNPAWYFIQVLGSESARENLVFTAQNNYLYGKVLDKTDDAQLFRFEKNNSNYFIINKLTEKKVDVTMNEGEEALSLSDEGIEFSFAPLADYYYNITASKTPTGGDASKKWAHQANANSSFKIILVNTTWNTGQNSQFSFIPYEDMNLEYSSSELETWYSIESAGSNSGCITDVTAANADIKLEIETYSEGNNNQLWKLLRKGTETNFMNKATGNIIQTQSNVSGNNILYNYTQLTDNETSSSGWTLTHIRAGQYSISGVENDDNITRYLSVSSEENAPDKYDETKLISSNFAWKFVKRAVADQNSIPLVQKLDDFYIYSESRRIIVEGTDDYTVKTIQGISVDNDTELLVGVYLVTIKGKTTKLFVK